jgi:hypothetical protein
MRSRACSKPSLSAVADAPDGTVAVFADQQAAVFGDGDSDRATPDFAVGRNEASHEVFVFTLRVAGRMIERHANDFVACAPQKDAPGTRDACATQPIDALDHRFRPRRWPRV